MVHYRLVYFNSRGRAELIRFIFAYAGQYFEDFRIRYEDWSSYKSKTILGQLPVLEISDSNHTLQLGQSLTIARYLANKFNLVGKNELEKVKL
jgi:prostaglandin-H2 D-isomerase / glutathione transferase